MDKIVFHCVVGLFFRILLIVFGEIHDKLYRVQYTDIDYRVFTDAARHMLDGSSPYQRHTYRYTPLIAALLVPNIFLHPAWGKFLFSLADIAASLLVQQLVLVQGFAGDTAIHCAVAWLYNPLAMVIATRGNADSISAVLVLVTMLLIQKRCCATFAGVVHALAIHVRLYPIAFSLAMYLAMRMPDTSSKQKRRKDLAKTSFSEYKFKISDLVPNRDQVCLVTSCISTLAVLTGVCYLLYGEPFLQESLLYHLSRRDTRHNFSVYFYMLYLGPPSLWQKALVFIPQGVLLLVLSLAFGSRRHLAFSLLTQALVMVTYNPVVTSQYFVWFLSLIPPCLPFLALSKWQATALASLWFAAQVSWLLPAYLLEFRGRETYLFIWIQGLAFFTTNIAILARLIKAYQPSELTVKKNE